MNKSQQKEMAQKLREAMQSEHWGVISYLESELYERKKSFMASLGFYEIDAKQNPVRKTEGQFALDMASAQGGIKYDHEMKTIRNNLLELLKETKDGE